MHMAVNVAGTNTLMFADSFEPVSYHRSTRISLVYDDLAEATAVERVISAVFFL